MRKLVVEPGGVVPWHSHAERPAIIYIIEGEINEYASNCTVPIFRKAGDVVAETKGISHWWKPFGDKTVVLLSADLLKGPDRPHDVRLPPSSVFDALLPPKGIISHPSFASRSARHERPHHTLLQPSSAREAHHSRRRRSHASSSSPSPPSSPSSICSPRKPSFPRSPSSYGVTPAQMGFAVNASTLGMAFSGLAVGYLQPRVSIAGRVSWISLLVLAVSDRAARASRRTSPRSRCCALSQGLCMAAAFTLTLAYLGEHYTAADWRAPSPPTSPAMSNGQPPWAPDLRRAWPIILDSLRISVSSPCSISLWRGAGLFHRREDEAHA